MCEFCCSNILHLRQTIHIYGGSGLQTILIISAFIRSLFYNIAFFGLCLHNKRLFGSLNNIKRLLESLFSLPLWAFLSSIQYNHISYNNASSRYDVATILAKLNYIWKWGLYFIWKFEGACKQSFLTSGSPRSESAPEKFKILKDAKGVISLGFPAGFGPCGTVIPKPVAMESRVASPKYQPRYQRSPLSLEND